jgi:hypothetical protein
MKYKTSKTFNNEFIIVNISLDDGCKNGHQDFSITGSTYEAGKPLIDKYSISGGCIHDQINAAFPEFKQFIDLHLSDYDGAPMHAIGNMHFHLYNGFNNMKPNNPEFKKQYCEYYRIEPVEFDTLKAAESKTDGDLFHYLLEALPIRARWKTQAEKAIKELEKLTGEKFVNTSTRSNYKKLDSEKINEIKLKLETGFYSPEARVIRASELNNKQKVDFFNTLDSDLEKLINNNKKEIDIKKQLYQLGGMHFVDNVIYYRHKNEIKCNWREYGEKLIDDEVKLIHETIKL